MSEKIVRKNSGQVTPVVNVERGAGDDTVMLHELKSYMDAPLRISDILSGPPLLPGEDELAYLTIVKWIAESLNPEDFVEAIWVKDIADAHWEAERNRRVRATYLEMLWRTKAVALLSAKLTPNLNDQKSDRQRAEIIDR